MSVAFQLHHVYIVTQLQHDLTAHMCGPSRRFTKLTWQCVGLLVWDSICWVAIIIVHCRVAIKHHFDHNLLAKKHGQRTSTSYGMFVVMTWLEICTLYCSGCRRHQLYHFLLHQNGEWFDILVPAYSKCPGNWPLNECSLCIHVHCTLRIKMLQLMSRISSTRCMYVCVCAV